MTDEIKEIGKSLIKRMDKLHDYLHKRLLKLVDKKVGNSEILLILEFKNILRDIQQYIEKDL